MLAIGLSRRRFQYVLLDKTWGMMKSRLPQASSGKNYLRMNNEFKLDPWLILSAAAALPRTTPCTRYQSRTPGDCLSSHLS